MCNTKPIANISWRFATLKLTTCTKALRHRNWQLLWEIMPMSTNFMFIFEWTLSHSNNFWGSHGNRFLFDLFYNTASYCRYRI